MNTKTSIVWTMFLVILMFADLTSVHAIDLDRLSQPKIQLGTRPFYLVDQMKNSKLKRELQQCTKKNRFHKSDFSISHRGAPLQFPEHTKESYEVADRMGAGIQECDVTFTKDGELVCRHAQCDLHTTTDVVAREDLRHQCKVPPDFDAQGNLTNAADITCCASDFTLEQFKTLKGKMDAADRDATTVEGYLGGTADFRTDLYASGGTLLTHKDSIKLFDRMGVKFTPELKSGNEDDIKAIFGSQENYAMKMIDEYRDAGIHPKRVFAQSFNLDDVLTWIKKRPRYGKQAVFLDGGPIPRPNPGPFLKDLADQGVKIVAPPIPMLLKVNQNGKVKPSKYAKKAKKHGLNIITWTAERSGRIVEDVLKGGNTFYYQTILEALQNDGDILKTIDILAQKVGVLGIFSDWPATTTFYANCKGIGLRNSSPSLWKQVRLFGDS